MEKPIDSPSRPRRLLGPGPSNVNSRVLQALGRPILGHLDPKFSNLMHDTQNLLRQAFRTSNNVTLPISGTGTAGMEASVANCVEEGDSVLVGIHGAFGHRIKAMVERNGGLCTVITAPFGEPLNEKKMLRAAEKCKPKVIAAVHAETSTGVLQPIECLREICDHCDALLLIDTVTSLGGHPLEVDKWKIDICYSGTQKCLSCPPGLSPITFSTKAIEKIMTRTGSCKSWYLDLSLIKKYWGPDRTYHHTAPISMNFGLHEALTILLEEGLENSWNRHRTNHEALVKGIEALGLDMYVSPEYRLWPLNSVKIPQGINGASVQKQLLEDFNTEIGGGLGELQGKIWRIGLMGQNSRPEVVLSCLFALGKTLKYQGFPCNPGLGLQAAADCYA
mgnify:CR=1 FL=1